jgi:hypothetical protein
MATSKTQVNQKLSTADNKKSAENNKKSTVQHASNDDEKSTMGKQKGNSTNDSKSGQKK